MPFVGAIELPRAAEDGQGPDGPGDLILTPGCSRTAHAGPSREKPGSSTHISRTGQVRSSGQDTEFVPRNKTCGRRAHLGGGEEGVPGRQEDRPPSRSWSQSGPGSEPPGGGGTGPRGPQGSKMGPRTGRLHGVAGHVAKWGRCCGDLPGQEGGHGRGCGPMMGNPGDMDVVRAGKGP